MFFYFFGLFLLFATSTKIFVFNEALLASFFCFLIVVGFFSPCLILEHEQQLEIPDYRVQVIAIERKNKFIRKTPFFGGCL
jgi:hypothetical protein